MLARTLVVCLILVTAAAARATAQRDTLPTAVATVFRQAYPNAKILNVVREMLDGKPVYEIESEDGPTRRDLLYSVDGQTLEVEEMIPADSLPAAVRAAVARDLPGATIVDGERIVKGSVTLYDVHARKGGQNRTLTYDPAGVRKE